MRNLISAASLATLAACTPQQQAAVATQAQAIDPALVSACSTAMTLAPVAGPIAPWIIGGCSTAEAITKLATDPTSLAWVNGLMAKVRQL